MFIGLLSLCGSLGSIFNTSNHTKCIALNKQQCMTQPALINLQPNKFVQELRYDPFAVNLDRCMGSGNTLNYLSNRVCVSRKKKIETCMFLIW